MAGSIDGIVSGMGTSQLVAQLMQLERQPQVRLQSQKSTLERILANYRGLNTKISAIGDAAKALLGANSWQPAKATSSDTARVTATATAGAVSGSLAFTVKQLATAASTITSGSTSSTSTVVTDRPLLVSKGAAPLGFGTFDQGSALATGAHTVAVVQSSAPATKAGGTAVASTTTISTGTNDALELSVNGVARTVTLAAGSYDPTQLAAEVTRALGGDVTAAIGTDGALSLTTGREGSAATLQVTAGTALSSLGLTTDAVALSGTDALVRLDGDATNELRVTTVEAGLSITLADGGGDSVVATLSGGLRAGTAALHQVEVAGTGTLKDVVDGINASGAGVAAAAVQVSDGVYRLQLTSTTTGSASGITLDPDAFPSSLSTLGAMQTATAGVDAVLSVGSGTAAYEVTRATNAFSDLLPGVTLSLLKADPATTVTVDVKTDVDAIAAHVAKMVDTTNATLSEIGKLTFFDPETKRAGLLAGDGLMRRLKAVLIDAVSGAVPGSALTPGLAGVAVQRDGTVKFDKDKFVAAYTKDPAAVEALFGKGTAELPGVAARVESAVKKLTDKVDGLLPSAVKSQEAQVKGYSERISSWDNRLALRELTLKRTFTAMEKALGVSQQQSQWLAGQLAGLANLRST